MKHLPGILCFGLLMTACGRQSLNQQLIGDWHSSEGEMVTFKTDGSFHATSVSTGHTNDYAGTWQINGKILSATATNTTGPDPELKAGDIVQFKIIKLDAHHFSYSVNGTTIELNR